MRSLLGLKLIKEQKGIQLETNLRLVVEFLGVPLYLSSVLVVAHCAFPPTCLVKLFAIVCSWGLAPLVSLPFFPNKLIVVVRHWSKGEKAGRQGMRAPKETEQLKCKDRGSERKERELNHRFPMLCAPWQQCLLLACEFKMSDLSASHPIPAECAPPMPWGSSAGTCTGTTVGEASALAPGTAF